MNINTRNMAFVNFNGQEMQWVKFNGVTVYEAWKNLIASGVPPLTLLNCKGVDLVDYKIFGESVQDGTPTPEAPIEVESVGDKTKNLVNIKKGTLTNCKIEYLDNGFKLTATSTKGYYDVPIELIKGNAYRVSFDSTRTGSTGGGYHSMATNTSITGSANDLNAKSYGVIASSATQNYDITHLRFYANNNGSAGDSATYTNIQLELGSTKTDYIPYGYKIPVEVSGKNIFNGVLKNGQFSYGEATNYRRVEITLEAGTYSISFSEKIYKQSSNITFTNPSGNFQTNTFTLTETTDCYIQFRGYDNVNGAGQTAEFFNSLKIQVEKGDTPTEYEPYVEPITTNIYLDEPLRKIGDYTDYIDFANKKVVRNIYNEYVSNVGFISSDVDTYKKFLTNLSQKPLLIGTGIQAVGYAISSKFVRSEQEYRFLGLYPNLIQPYITNAKINRIAYTFDDSSITTLEQANEKIGDGFEVNYVLATPIEEDIELPNIPTFKGMTVLSVGTEIQPSNIEVVYKGK